MGGSPPARSGEKGEFSIRLVLSTIRPLRIAATEMPDRKSTRLNSSHSQITYTVFFLNDTAPTEIYPLSLHDALPISFRREGRVLHPVGAVHDPPLADRSDRNARSEEHTSELQSQSNHVYRLFFE